MKDDRSWKEYTDLAKHYKAIGETNIYLFRDRDDLPWHLAQTVNTGGMHRLGIPVSFEFSGADSKTGLTFRWGFDLEKKSASGKGQFDIDIERVNAIRSHLPHEVSRRFSGLVARNCQGHTQAR